MRARRVSGLAASAILAVMVLTGCSAGINGVAALGYDRDHNLVGGFKVCHADTGSASLSDGEGHTGKWHRSTKGHGTEIWRLASKSDGRWVQDSAPPAVPSGDSHLQFDVISWGGPQWHGFVDASGEDLAALPAGHLIVVDQTAAATSTADVLPAKIISLDELSQQPCPAA